MDSCVLTSVSLLTLQRAIWLTDDVLRVENNPFALVAKPIQEVPAHSPPPASQSYQTF